MAEMNVLLIPRKDPSKKGEKGETGNGTEYEKSNSNCGVAVFDIHKLAQKLVCAIAQKTRRRHLSPLEKERLYRA